MESGTKLGHYEISTLLGKGGMGEVWRARDTKLGREVAIKTLPEEFAKDADRLARFEREAKLLASLNHPNIAAIHGFEEDNGTHFLVLELVEGDTLGDRVKRGAIPVEESLKLALQIAEALEAAHEKGVIHRDLKPANIKVTPDGKVKVLDFGLAKAFEGDAAEASVSNSPTLSMAATQQGVILGTAAYMSPEQARGENADQRADVWAFGVVLFEMLTGHGTFDGRTVSDVLAGVLRADPEWNALPASLHPRVRSLLERCLAKDLRSSYTGIGDARVDIEDVLADPAGILVKPVADGVPAAPQSKLLWLAGMLLTLIIGGAAVWLLQPTGALPIIRFDYELPEGIEFSATGRQVVAISPDGQQFLYNAQGGVYIRTMDGLEARLIAGIGEVVGPVFSPDGQEIAYTEFPMNAGGRLMKVAATGGAPIVLAESVSSNFGKSWELDGTILFAGSDGIWQVSENGGTPVQLISIQEDELAYGAQLLPGGEWVLFTLASGTGATRWDEADVVLESVSSGERRVLWQGGSDARYVPTGHLIYALGDVLFAMPFDLNSLELSGGPVSIVQGVQRGSAGRTGATQYSFSDDGTLVYVPGGASDLDFVLALVDRQGVVEPLDVPPNQYRHPRISPEGGRVAVETSDDEGEAIWIYDLSGDTQIRRLTLAREGSNSRPIWTPDGDSITFTSDRDGTLSIYRQPADGSGLAERLTMAEEGTDHRPDSWSPDGQTLSFTQGPDPESLWTLSLDGGDQPELFYDVNDSRQAGTSFSPDGRWVAYVSNEESPLYGIYVQPFPPTGVIYPVVEEGGVFPLWSPDGRELFYRRSIAGGGPAQLVGMDIETEPGFAFGVEQVLPIRGFRAVPNLRDYDIMPDGDQFLVVFPTDRTDSVESAGPQVNIVLNWFEELKERVPVP